MKYTYFIVILVIVCLLSFCSHSGSTATYEICGAYAVPCSFHRDLRGRETTAEIIEKDEYGRVMFLYTAPDFLTGKNETSVVICQKIKKDTVYFYEDICYERYSNETKDYKILKSKNDWNLPLDDSKMTSRKTKTTFDGYIIIDSSLDRERIKEICCKELGIFAYRMNVFYIDDVQPDGTEIYFLKATVNKTEKNYFVRVDKEYNMSFFEIADSHFEVTEDYLNFKNPEESR